MGPDNNGSYTDAGGTHSTAGENVWIFHPVPGGPSGNYSLVVTGRGTTWYWTFHAVARVEGVVQDSALGQSGDLLNGFAHAAGEGMTFGGENVLVHYRNIGSVMSDADISAI